MLKIAYPDHQFRIKEQEGKEYIFDEIRRLWVRLTPEEWVRQNFLQYIIQQKHYPPSLIAVESEIRLNDLRKRCDIIVYKDEKPWMIVECKEMNQSLGEDVLMQVLRYNSSIPSVFLVITNGNNTNAWHLIDGKAKQLDEIPAW